MGDEKTTELVEVSYGFDTGQTDENPAPVSNGIKLYKESTDLKTRLKDPHYRTKLWQTAWIAGVNVSFGMCMALSGPTLLDIMILTNTDLEQASAFFTGMQTGFITGSFLAGAIFSKVNANFLLFLAAFGLGAVNILVPFCRIYAAMIVNRVALGVFSGLLATAVNTRHMRIWGTEGQALTQFIFFCFAVGGAMTPLYTEPFLAARGNDTAPVKLYAVQVAHHNYTFNETLYRVQSFDGNSTDSESLAFRPRKTNVQYAFYITAAFLLFSAVPFFVSFLKDLSHKKKGKHAQAEKVTQRQLPTPLLLFLLGTLCMIYLVYCGMEGTFVTFLMTFLVNEYDFVTKSQAAYTTAIFWVTMAVSRGLMIFMSKCLSAVGLTYLSGGIMLAAYTGFLISAMFEAVDAISVFAGMAGLGMSAVFGACFSWAESELFKITGPVSSSIVICVAIGNIVMPVTLAYLMEEVDNMWFCYLMLGATLLFCLLFVFLLYFNRLYVNKHYGPMNAAKEMSITEGSPEDENKIPLRESQNGETGYPKV